MGTWGSGNFDSDGALDAISERSNDLIAHIWRALQSDASAEADEGEHDALFVDLEWLLTLEAAGAFNGWGLPPVAALDVALHAWLAAWSAYFDGLSGPEFKAERQAVIEATFARLRAVCSKYEAQRA